MIDIVKNMNAVSVILAEQTPISEFAANELQKYIYRMTKCLIPINNKIAEASSILYIGTAKWIDSCVKLESCTDGMMYDGFFIKSIDNHSLILTSNSNRGVLYAVYAFLEYLGCRWFFPGISGEHIPSCVDICIDCPDMLENPSYETRAFTYDGSKEPTDMWVKEISVIIDWCCKNRINSFFIHCNPFNEIKGIGLIQKKIKDRGMFFEIGGHGVHELVNRELFEDKPWLFREKDGMRRKDGNFCGSSEEAMRSILDGVKKFLHGNPTVDVLHLWFDDVYGGSWCECEKCRNIPAPMQQMNVISRIAEEIRETAPDVKIDMLLYHDTLEYEIIEAFPRSNLLGFFAPRERCRSHSIGNVLCERNMDYFARLKNVADKFGSNTYIFEYYADMILFSKMKVSFPRIISQDLKEYKSAGINKISCLMFGNYSIWAYSLNMFVFAKAAWDILFDYDEGIAEFYRVLFPENYKSMMEYNEWINKGTCNILGFCQYDDLTDIRNIPPQSLEFYSKHIEQLKAGIDILNKCLRLLDELIEASAAGERHLLIKERQILHITVKETEAVYFQMLGRYLYHTGESDIEDFKAYMDLAIKRKIEIKDNIETIQDEMKGCCGRDLFIKHLCNDQIDFLEILKKEPERRNYNV